MRLCNWIKVLLMTVAAFPTGLPAATVCNAGYPGENSAQILRRLPEALAACPQPAFLVLFVGMNDAVNDKQFLAPKQTFNVVLQILKRFTALQGQSLVVTVHMPDERRLMQRHSLAAYGNRSPAQRIQDTNRALRKAAKQGRAKLVDFNEVLSKAGGASDTMSTDGVHLTPEGYRLLAAAVASALPANASEKTVLCLGDSLTYGIGVRTADAPDAGSDSYPQQLEGMLNYKP